MDKSLFSEWAFNVASQPPEIEASLCKIQGLFQGLLRVSQTAFKDQPMSLCPAKGISNGIGIHPILRSDCTSVQSDQSL